MKYNMVVDVAAAAAVVVDRDARKHWMTLDLSDVGVEDMSDEQVEVEVFAEDETL
jgi:hypothetical protein